jgi:hypothetical protein
VLIDAVSTEKEPVRLGEEVASSSSAKPKYELEDCAGPGHHGGAFILSKQVSSHRTPQKMMIKYSYGGCQLTRIRMLMTTYGTNTCS